MATSRTHFSTHTLGDETQTEPASRKKRTKKMGLLPRIGVFLLILLLSIVVGIFLAYHNREALIAKYIESISDGYDVSFEKIDIEKRGRVTISKLALNSPNEGESPLFSTDKVLIGYDWGVLRSKGQVGSIHIDRPVLHIPESIFAKRAEATKGKRRSADLSFLNRISGHILVEDGELMVDHPRLDPVRGKWRISQDAVELTDLVLGDGAGSIAKIQAGYDKAELAKNGPVASSLLIDRPVLKIDPAWFVGEDSADSESGQKERKRGWPEWIQGPMEIRQAQLSYTHPGSVLVRGRLNFHTDHPGHFGADGLSQTPYRLTLDEVEVGEQAVFGGIGSLSAVWRMSSDARRYAIESLELDEPMLTAVPAWFPERITAENQEELDAKRPAMDPLAISVDRLKISRADLSWQGFDGSRAGAPRFPDLSFGVPSLDWSDLSIREGRLDSAGLVELAVTDLDFKGGSESLVRADSAVFRAKTLGAVVHDGHLMSASGSSADIYISDDSISYWRRPDRRRSKESSGYTFRVDSLGLPDAIVQVRDLQAGFYPIPHIETEISTLLVDLSFDRRGMHTSSLQIAKLSELSLHGPGVDMSSQPLLNFSEAELEVVWDRFMIANVIEKLEIQAPVLTFTDSGLGSWMEPRDRSKLPIGPINRPVFRIKDLDIYSGILHADADRAFDGMVPKVTGLFELHNEEIGQEAGELGYRLKLSGLKLRNHGHGQALGNPLFPGQSVDSEEVAKIAAAEVDFTAVGIQRQRRIKKVKVSGGELQVGEGLKDVVKKPPANRSPSEAAPMSAEGEAVESENPKEGEEGQRAPDESETTQGQSSLEPAPETVEPLPIISTLDVADEPFRQPARRLPGILPMLDDPIPIYLNAELLGPEQVVDLPELPPLDGDADRLPGALGLFASPKWQIDDLEISDTKINFDSLIPQMEGLSFGLETKMQDIPLTPDGLLDASKLQSVKLDSIEIRDPYDAFLTVAELPDVFVEFSIAGLTNQEIEKIDIISPTLYIGESLFRWIDYLRNYRAINEGAIVDVRGSGLFSRRDEAETETPEESDYLELPELDEPESGETDEPGTPSWVINTINATAGKLVVAPYGTAITSIPFPFTATTSVDGEKIKLEMVISEDQAVYSLPQYKVDLTGLEGDIDFNLPIPEEDNNLVQTFGLREAKWKKLRATDMFLSITYDQFGIYGIFGGDAYGGYANGAFNYYLTENGRWDAWLAGTGLDTGRLSSELVPNGFSMGGEVDVKLFTDGKNADLGLVTGELTTVGDGWFDIEAMDKALDKLPEQWNGLQRGLAKITVDSLKRFDYSKGTGEISLDGDDGELKLRFDGDYGSRSITLHLHDWQYPFNFADSVRR